MIAADNLCSVGTRLSEYARKLPQENLNVRKRYIEKIKIIKFNDPYTLQLSSDMPTTVTTGHVVDYLINFKSPYTGESVKNLRSLDAYRKFEAGFVQSMKGRLMENFYIVVGKVAHTMRLNEKPLNPWVIVQKEGMIIPAHCDCAAGISETCSHVSAILYALANLHQLTMESAAALPLDSPSNPPAIQPARTNGFRFVLQPAWSGSQNTQITRDSSRVASKKIARSTCQPPTNQ
nr:LOW QUALITY PROTEIN: uncharacterized protein LOC115258411 [Aedes albopictus]